MLEKIGIADSEVNGSGEHDMGNGDRGSLPRANTHAMRCGTRDESPNPVLSCSQPVNDKKLIKLSFRALKVTVIGFIIGALEVNEA
jgi:hypothetical protein